MKKWRLVAVITVLALLRVNAPATADTESPKLAKYNEDIDKAVAAGLQWLAQNQADTPAKDGSFTGNYGNTTAIAGLAGMAFLSKGYTPGRPPYGDVINKCVDFILAHQAPDGSLEVAGGGGGMYAHGIATLMLSEVSGMVDPERQKKINVVLPKALRVILTAQKIRKQPMHQGGWRYTPSSPDSDISVTGWCMMALRSARLNGAAVPQSAIDDAHKFIMNMRHRGSGGFCYSSPQGPGVARTSVALLCLELTGRHNDEVTRKAGDYILANMVLDNQTTFLNDGYLAYSTYYGAQGMFQLGGEYWERFADVMYTFLIKTQQPDGHWTDGQGDVFATAMNVLALTVSYRQLPIYQRGSSGGEERASIPFDPSPKSLQVER